MFECPILQLNVPPSESFDCDAVGQQIVLNPVHLLTVAKASVFINWMSSLAFNTTFLIINLVFSRTNEMSVDLTCIITYSLV